VALVCYLNTIVVFLIHQNHKSTFSPHPFPLTALTFFFPPFFHLIIWL